MKRLSDVVGLCRSTIRAKTVTAVLVAAGFGLISQTVVADEIVGRLSYHWSPTHTSAVYAEMFAEEVNKRAKGRLRIETYPNKQLFGIREVLGALTAGSVELGAVIGIVGFPSVVKDFNIASFPGMWASFEHQRKFFSEDPEGQKLWNAVLDKTKTKLVMYDPVGPVLSCSMKSPMDTVASYEGLKARRLFGTEKPLWKALKVDYQKLGTRDVYTALQTGMVDTVNTVPNGLKAYSWWEFLKFCQIPYLSYADAYVLANGPWVDSLPDDLRQILTDVGKEIGDKASANIMDASAGILEEFKSHGGTVTVLQGAAKAEFDQLLADVVFPALSGMVSADLLKAAQAFSAD